MALMISTSVLSLREPKPGLRQGMHAVQQVATKPSDCVKMVTSGNNDLWLMVCCSSDEAARYQPQKQG